MMEITPKKFPTFLEAKIKLEAWCAYQERCQFEVDQKMMQWHFSEEQRNTLIADLISNRFIDEERFAEAFVSGKFNIKKWGRIKIKMHLKQKRISAYSTKKAFEQLDGDVYFETLVELGRKKKRLLSSSSKGMENWQFKTQHYLSSKGYEFDLIIDAIQQIKLEA